MFTVTVPVAITPQERAQIRADELARNELQARDQVRRLNLDAGKPDPKPGDSLFVATARGIKTRGRAGLQFSETPAEVKVTTGTDAEITTKQKAGAFVVNEWGAAQIVADSNESHTGLILFTNKDAAAGRAKSADDMSTEELEAALARKRAAAPRDVEPKIGARTSEAAKATSEASKSTTEPAKPKPETKG